MGNAVVQSPEITTSISLDALASFCERALTTVGVTSVDAQTTASALVMTDSWGVFTHGTKLLAGYVRRLRHGGLRADCRPQVVAEGPAWAIVDGQSTLGQVASTFAVERAIEKAQACGIAYVGVRNSCHFGAAGYYTWLAARANMIGLAMANDVPSVAAPGSRGAILGSNPLAFAVPTGGADPILLDISTATVAGGKVYASRKRGEPIPDGWLIGPDGRPTNDGALYPEHASLAPMSGHKGYGIGLLIETLSGLVSGASFTHRIGSWIFGDPSLPTDHGAAFIVLNVAAMMPAAQFADRVAMLVDEIHNAPPAEGCQRVMLPGERELAHRRLALAEGLRLPSDVTHSLEQLAHDLGLAFPASIN